MTGVGDSSRHTRAGGESGVSGRRARGSGRRADCPDDCPRAVQTGRQRRADKGRCAGARSM
eukprot:6632110-Prymnesium_polylepis.1